jgi:hypothetical protein
MHNPRVNAQAEEAGVRLHFGYRIKKADFDAGQLTFETSEGDKTVMVCFASGPAAYTAMARIGDAVRLCRLRSRGG